MENNLHDIDGIGLFPYNIYDSLKELNIGNNISGFPYSILTNESGQIIQGDLLLYKLLCYKFFVLMYYDAPLINHPLANG